MKMYKVKADGNFLMIAPMLVIAGVFGLHQSAVERCVTTIEGYGEGGFCELFLRRSKPSWLGADSIMVTEAEALEVTSQLL